MSVHFSMFLLSAFLIVLTVSGQRGGNGDFADYGGGNGSPGGSGNQGGYGGGNGNPGGSGNQGGSNQLLNLNCRWEVKLKTGNIQNAGTRGNIGIQIHFPDPLEVNIPLVNQRLLQPFTIFNLKEFGDRGRTPNNPPYFHRNNLDVFHFNGPCLPNICKITFLNGEAFSPYRDPWYLQSATVSVRGLASISGPSGTVSVGRWIPRNDNINSWNITLNFCVRTIIQD